MKHTCVDETKNPSKNVALSFRQWETTSMPPPKARTLKHIEVLELNNDDDFSSIPIQTMGKSTLPQSTKSFIKFQFF